MASDHGDMALPDCGDAIDPSTFEQILEMDDDEEREFSKSIVFGFFEQASNTFEEMQTKLNEKKMKDLSSLGHFLKGSSATLGLTKVRDGCEKIQHYGARKNDAGDDALEDDSTFLAKIKDLLPIVRRDYEDAEKRLRAFYGDSNP